MDEISKLQSTEVLISSRFFMSLRNFEEGESIVLSKTYSTETLSLQEVDDLAAKWDVTLKREVIERFTYGPSEINDSFGLVSLSFTKLDYSEIGADISTDTSNPVSSRNFTYEIKITALQPIAAQSLLRV